MAAQISRHTHDVAPARRMTYLKILELRSPIDYCLCLYPHWQLNLNLLAWHMVEFCQACQRLCSSRPNRLLQCRRSSSLTQQNCAMSVTILERRLFESSHASCAKTLDVFQLGCVIYIHIYIYIHTLYTLYIYRIYIESCSMTLACWQHSP